MGIFFALVAVVAYLGFFVDWKEFMGVFRLGGWATVGVYIVLTILIVGILSTPETAAVAPAVHH
ncbi:MAG: hypothetical protein RBT64_01910 [Trichloromonas sp.]|jgi:hypothetical protein|nr:hypothetical protein [Trichloromonas sp.]